MSFFCRYKETIPELVEHLLLLWFGALILVCWPATSTAYFHIPAVNETDLIKTEKELQVPKSWSSEFVVYDDLFGGQTENGQVHVLRPYNEDFLGFDKIYLGTPFFKVSRISFKNEFTLESLLYANLKLKMLIEDNETKKKQVKMLFEGLRIPFWDQADFIETAKLPAVPPPIKDGLENQEIDSVQNSLLEQRRQYVEIYSASQFATANTSQNAEGNKGRNTDKKGRGKGAAVGAQEPSTDRSGSGSGYVDDNAVGKDDYAVVVSRNKKSIGLIATVLIWVVGFYNFVITDPIVLVLAIMMCFFSIALLLASLSNMQK